MIDRNIVVVDGRDRAGRKASVKTMETPPTLDAFVDACRPLAKTRDHESVSRLMRQLIADPADFAATVPAFPDPEPSSRGWTLGGEHICHQTDELTVMVLDTLPGVIQPPHDHEMHAIIGVFEGIEQQRFYARGSDGVTETAGRSLEAGDVIVLGERAIHAISSPPGHAARAIHVYFGDIYDVQRSLYHPDTLEPVPFSTDGYDEFCRAATDPGPAASDPRPADTEPGPAEPAVEPQP